MNNFLDNANNTNSYESFGLNNIVELLGNIDLKHLKINIEGNNNLVRIAENVKFTTSILNPSHYKNEFNFIYIKGNNNVLSIDSDCFFQNSTFMLDGYNGNLTLGKNVTSRGTFFSVLEKNGTIKIGDGTMFSAETSVTNSDFHSIISTKTNVRINPSKDVFIDKKVWICKNVNILKGSSIGKFSVIGLGSVVRGNIPSNCVATGNPCVIIKKNIYWERKLTEVSDL